MRAFALQPDSVPAAEAAALAEALLASPLVARSTLAGSFRGSRGFALTFTFAGRPEAEARFPGLGRFLALADGSARALGAWLGRAPNAWYVNLLVLGPGAGVGRHVDATLREPAGQPDALPTRVTVLYLAVPEPLAGGELRLFEGERALAEVRPRPGALLHFRGDLAHEVAPVQAAEGALRVSLVCEQYRLPRRALARLGPLRVQSKAGFDAYLASRA